MGTTQTLGRGRHARDNGFLVTLPAFRRTLELLLDGSSVILYGPRHFELEMLALAALERALEGEGQKILIRLGADVAGSSGGLDFTALWAQVVRQLGLRSRKVVDNKPDFIERTRKALDKSETPLVVFLLRSGGRESTARFRDLIETIHQLVDEPETDRMTGRSLFIAIDDYLLHYHIQAGELRSEWFRARWVEAPHLALAEIEDSLTRLIERPTDGVDRAAELALQLLESTGGHVGMIHELLEWARTQEYPIEALFEPQVRPQTLKHLENSAILQRIRNAIDDDTLGLCATALEHCAPKMPVEYRSPRIQILRQLGILVWENAVEARLCGGPLGKMVEAVAARQAAPKLGTVASVEGMTRYESETFLPDEDDICVLHLSDLHFGADFGYRLRVGGRAINEDRLDIAALIEHDLRAQNLAGRIDAVVISGDVACSGISEEYHRAADAIDDLMRVLGVDHSRLIVVPGNHDLRWNPGVFARQEGSRNVSREDFDGFFRRVCRRNPAPADLVRVTSRGGGTALAIVALDSNEVESEEAAGIGFVGEDSLREAARLAREASADEPPPQLWFVLHHHLTPVTSAMLGDARHKAVSVLANAPSVLQLVRDAGAEVVLHGHEHQPSVTELRWWLGERDSVFGRVVSICAGSLSAKRERLGPVSRNQYMVLVRRPQELIVRSRLMGDEGISFQSHEDIAVPLSAARRRSAGGA